MLHSIYCGVQGVDPVAVLIHVDGSGNRYLAIPWGALTGTPEENEEWIVSVLQNLFQSSTPIADLPDGHPYKLADPGMEHLFWDETETYIVSRSVLITSAMWNDPDGKPDSYHVCLRRTIRPRT